MLTALVLLATVALRFGFIATAVYLLLPRSPACPRCGAALALIRHALWGRLLPLVHHRWCLDCGWSGLVRRAAPPDRHSRVISRAARSYPK